MKLVMFALFGLYSKLWRFVDQKDFEAIVKAVVVSSVVVIVGLFVLSTGQHRPAARRDRARLPAHARCSSAASRFLVRAVVERPTRGRDPRARPRARC